MFLMKRYRKKNHFSIERLPQALPLITDLCSPQHRVRFAVARHGDAVNYSDLNQRPKPIDDGFYARGIFPEIMAARFRL